MSIPINVNSMNKVLNLILLFTKAKFHIIHAF